jgi:hypothetical protein
VTCVRILDPHACSPHFLQGIKPLGRLDYILCLASPHYHYHYHYHYHTTTTTRYYCTVLRNPPTARVAVPPGHRFVTAILLGCTRIHTHRPTHSSSLGQRERDKKPRDRLPPATLTAFDAPSRFSYSWTIARDHPFDTPARCCSAHSDTFSWHRGRLLQERRKRLGTDSGRRASKIWQQQHHTCNHHGRG